MLHYFRFVSFYIKSLFKKPHPDKTIFMPHTFSLRATPFDCNAFMIMDNAKFNQAVDLGKFYILIYFKKLNAIIKRHWYPLTICVELSIFRPIKLFSKFEVSSQVIYWENGYIYMVHKFLVKNVPHAMAISRSCCIHDGKVVSDDELNELYNVLPPEKPLIVEQWQALSSSKKEL